MGLLIRGLPRQGTKFCTISEPIRQGLARHFGGAAPDTAVGLILRHDHGSNYMSDDFQNEITCFGITSSPAFVRQPEGNGVAERAIRTIKEQLLWVRRFATVEELRQALAAFAAQYNASWIHQRHGYKTPDKIRADQKALETEAAMGTKMAALPAQRSVSKPCPSTPAARRSPIAPSAPRSTAFWRARQAPERESIVHVHPARPVTMEIRPDD